MRMWQTGLSWLLHSWQCKHHLILKRQCARQDLYKFACICMLEKISTAQSLSDDTRKDGYMHR